MNLSLFKRLLIMICLISTLYGCSKDNDEPGYQTELSFDYNGQHYKLTSGFYTESLFDVTSFRFLYTGGLIINRPDLFGGEIHIDYDHPSRSVRCAWLQPANYPLIQATDCSNLNVGSPIDSVKVYWLHSASYSETFSKCKPTEVGPFKQCQLEANFSLTLANKNNQLITISNGKLRSRIELRN